MKRSLLDVLLPELKQNKEPKPIDTTSCQTIRQTQCYTALELLQEMLNEEHKAYQDNIDNYMVSSHHDFNIEALNNVTQLIKERQANVV